MIEIIKENPPFLQDLLNVGLKPREDTVFPFGLKIYNPSGKPIPGDIMVHEAVHIREQGKDPQAWWRRYMLDKEFRLAQELKANRKQYEFIREAVKDRNARYRALHAICKNISSEIYGNIITYADAKKLIEN